MLRNILKKKNLERVRVFSKTLTLENKGDIEQDVEEGNLKQYKNISEQYYYYYIILQEQSRKAYVQEQLYLEVRDQASTVLINQFNKEKDYLALQFITKFDLYQNLNIDQFTKELAENVVQVNYTNIQPLSNLLQKFVQRQENEQLQSVLYNKLSEFIKTELERRVYSISNDDFDNILQGILVLVDSNIDFVQTLPDKLGFKYIQQKLQDYEDLEDLIQPDIMPSILYHSEKISQATQYKFKMNVQLYDNLLKNLYKTLDNDQIFYSVSFFLLHLREDQQISSRFFEQFYFSQLKQTSYYQKEYLIRKLGIYNFDQPLLKLIRTALTRIFLLNVTQKEPRYRKTINLLPLQKLELVNSMLQNVQYKNSPLIDTLLSESIASISQIYMYNVQLDFTQEYSQLHIIYREVIQILSESTNDLLLQNKDTLYFLRIIFNYYSLHSNKFDTNMVFNLIKIVNKVTQFDYQSDKQLNDNNSQKDKQQVTQLSLLFQEQQFKLFMDIFKSNFSKILQGKLPDIQLVNHQDIIIPSLQLISKIFSNQFEDSIEFVKQIASNLDKINLENKLSLIDSLNKYSDNHKIAVVEVLQLIINKFGDAKVLSETFELKSKFLMIFMKLMHELGDPNKYLRILESKVKDLMSFEIINVNESDILIIIQLIKQSQQSKLQLKDLDALQDVFFRIISDEHSTFSLENYEKIVTVCMSLNNFEKNFDDGSECYTQTLLEELRQYNTDNYKKLSPEFQKLIEPYIFLEDNPLNKYLETLKEKISEIAQN